ncbi:MAG: hypothetical protein ABIC04_04765 [Nanoarchaeota archaeon]
MKQLLFILLFIMLHLEIVYAEMPIISIISPQNSTTLKAGTESVSINITTDANSTCEYNPIDFSFGFGTKFTFTGYKSHYFNFTGLNDGVTYTLYYRCNNSISVNNESTIHLFSINNSAQPIISEISLQSPVSLIEGGAKDIYICFNVTDDNINHSSAAVLIKKSGEINRESSGCSINSETANTVKYNCTVTFFFYDGAGIWDVNISITDNSMQYTSSFANITINPLDAIVVNDTQISFGSLFASTFDNSGDIIKLTNNGNTIYSNISAIAYDLIGSENASYQINADHFEIATSAIPNTGINLTNGTSIQVASASLSKGVSVTEELYFYVDVPADPIPQVYSSVFDWVIITNG